MATQTEELRGLFDRVLETMQKAAAANLEAQQELLKQWTNAWPAMPTPQAAWTEKVRQFRKDWSTAVADLMTRQRKAADEQYRAAIEALEESMHMFDAESPEEYRRRLEELCRKSLSCMKEMAETQTREFQKAMTKWMDLLGKTGSQ